MKWEPRECTYGDMVRVRLGFLYHYGIFVSESEVIQFGMPPVPEYREHPDAGRVCVTDMEVFSCGKIPEVGVPSVTERLRRFSAKKTVALATARIGEIGYDILHNNCEHFVFECAFGEKKCTQVDDAVERWKKWQETHSK